MHPEKVQKWYGQNVVKYEIVKALQNRELAFMNLKNQTVRDLSGWNVKYLDMCMEAYRFFPQEYRMYMSVGTLNNTPITSFNPKQKKIDKADVKEAWKYPDGYDFVIDIDAPDLNKAKKETLKLCKLFDEDNIPYSVNFSGCRGFHVRVEDKYLPSVEDKPELCRLWAISLCDIEGVNYIDATIYDKRRILKVPYSLDHKSGEYLVVLPLSEQQMNAFNVEDVKLDKVWKDIRLFQRGMLTRAGSSEDVRLHLKDRGLI